MLQPHVVSKNFPKHKTLQANERTQRCGGSASGKQNQETHNSTNLFSSLNGLYMVAFSENLGSHMGCKMFWEVLVSPKTYLTLLHYLRRPKCLKLLFSLVTKQKHSILAEQLLHHWHFCMIYSSDLLFYFKEQSIFLKTTNKYKLKQ